MKIKKKKGIKKVRITHNKSLLYVIAVLFVLFIIVIILAMKNSPEKEDVVSECNIDTDCVPDTCCHPESCVAKDLAPDCTSAFCSLECSSVLDCEASSCSCVNNKCEVINNK
ncbi:hypothetical protein GOV14_04620 [Candidatus Pacearchaeota archaeon]|nr:hypothetical protein [Candidatus Pacearchaeota archaeon]